MLLLRCQEERGPIPRGHKKSIRLGMYLYDYCMIACNLGGQVSSLNTLHDRYETTYSCCRVLSLSFRILLPYAVPEACFVLNSTLI